MSTFHGLRGRAGDTFAYTILAADADGAAIDLTGGSVEWSLKSGDTEHQYIDNAQASITTPASGEITLTLTPTETRALAGSIWRYEVTLTYATTARQTVLHGFMSFALEVIE